jgi:MiaB/RimO family radical SAM methylthiotransferase
MNKKIKVHIVGNGCDRRLLESSKLSQYFKENKCEVINSPAEADYIFVNTCAMSKGAEDTSFNLIKQFEKYKGEVIVHGCLPAIAPTRFNENFQGTFFHSKSIEDIDKHFTDFETKFTDVQDPVGLAQDQSFLSKFFNKFEISWNFFVILYVALKFKLKNKKAPLHPRLREGLYFQISRGCSEACTYCAIPKAVGSIKSKPLEQCLVEYKQKLEEGHRRFIFTADNIGLYGLDLKTNFADLLNRMGEIDSAYEGVKWLILELHPRWAIKYKEEILKHIKSGKIEELCVPIQSGSDRLLQLMKRHNHFHDTLNVLETFREASPSLKFNTDVLIGYPTETEDDFMDTIKLITRGKFDRVQFFGYADRENTPANDFPVMEKISNKIILKRLYTAMKILDKEQISYTYQ